MTSSDLQSVGDGPTPPPGSAQGNTQRQGIKIKEVTSPGAQQAAQAALKQEERTTTDTSMVQALNRRR